MSPSLSVDAPVFTPAAPQLRGGQNNPATGWWVPFYVGTLKSFNLRSGYGFLECKETFAIYNTDVYIHKSQVPLPWKLGQLVEFGVTQNRYQQPQATDVMWLPMVAPRPEDDAKKQIEKAANPKRYIGTLKSFSTSQGYGFITSEEAVERRSCDVYLDRGQLPQVGPVTPGQVIEFEIIHNKHGQPQARHVDWDPVPYLRRLDPAASAGPAVRALEYAKARSLDKILSFLRAEDHSGALRMAIDLQEGSDQIDYLSFVLEHLGQPSPEIVAGLTGATPNLLLMTLSKLLAAGSLTIEGGRAASAVGWCVAVLDSGDKIQYENVATGVQKNIEAASSLETYSSEPTLFQNLLEKLSNSSTPS